MNSWKKYALAAVIAVAAGFVYVKSQHGNVPADFRDAPADEKYDEFNIHISSPYYDALESRVPPVPVPVGTKGYIAGNDPSVGGRSFKPVEWVAISGGKFMMGTDSGERGFENAKPVHEVAVKTFYMSKTAVTVEQYEECVIKGKCTEPGTGVRCEWGQARKLYPVNCVDWKQANQYARFKGARLPSESEWEYAATSGGRNQKYPWGNEAPTCDRVVRYGNGGSGCGNFGTMPVCSKTAGNTAQGLCDMAGNVWQWVEDNYQDSYKGAPIDGSAFKAAGGVPPRRENGKLLLSIPPDSAFSSLRVVRGGSFDDGYASAFRADYRHSFPPGLRYDSIGFRLARSSR